MNKYKEMERAFSEWKKGRTPPDKIPEGWITVKEFAKKNNASIRTASDFLKAMREQKRVEVKKFVIDVGMKVYSVVHYKIK